MVDRNLDGSYLLTLYREWIKSIRKKNGFLKNISKDYKKRGKIFNFLRYEFGQKNLRGAARQKKKEKHRQGGHEKGLRKRDGKKMVMDGVSL